MITTQQIEDAGRAAADVAYYVPGLAGDLAGALALLPIDEPKVQSILLEMQKLALRLSAACPRDVFDAFLQGNADAGVRDQPEFNWCVYSSWLELTRDLAIAASDWAQQQVAQARAAEPEYVTQQMVEDGFTERMVGAQYFRKLELSPSIPDRLLIEVRQETARAVAYSRRLEPALPANEPEREGGAFEATGGIDHAGSPQLEVTDDCGWVKW